MNSRRETVAALIAFVALTLAVVSALHLSHVLDSGSKPFNPTAAGIAEALIGVVLGVGAVALLLPSRHAREIGIGATAFAIVGFVVGLSFTARGGGEIDIAYHAVVLPLLLVTLLALRRPLPARAG
jgi:hypothetical protein